LQPNTLTFFDLGYLDLERFVDMTQRGAFFLTRLKSNHNPVIRRVHVGSGRRVKARGMRLDDALEQGILDFSKELIDLDIVLDDGKKQVVGRVVGIQNESGEQWWYVTNVSRDVLPAADVGLAYTLRWDIELLFKQLKSGAGLSAVLAWRSSAVLAFLYAKIVALCLARLLELTVEKKSGPHATTQLALLLTLSRSMPLLLGIFMLQRGVTLSELEDRIIMIASIVARSRRQRRERAKRKKRRELGK
ncbi:transposase, partial [Myxococcota bacterium]